jgi:hypothetical protein
VLNAFRGFWWEDVGVVPDHGSTEAGGTPAELFDDILLHLCGDVEAHFRWLRGLLGHMLWQPGKLEGLAVVLYGAKGCAKSLVVELICKLLAQDGPSCGEMWSSTCNPGADFHTRFTNATKRDRRLLLRVDEAKVSEEKLHNMFKAMMDQHEMACEPKVNASTWPTTCAGSSLPKTTPTLCLCRARTGSSLSSAPQTGKIVPG